MTASESTVPAKRSLVIIHGVGATSPAGLLRESVGELAGPTASVEVRGHSYEKVKLDGLAGFDEAYQVYWANLKPGGDSGTARLLRMLDVLLALSIVGGWGWSADEEPSSTELLFGKILHAFLWSFVLALPCFYLPLLYTSTLRGPVAPMLAIASILPTLGIAAYLRSRSSWCSLALALGLAAAGISLSIGLSADAEAPVGEVTTAKMTAVVLSAALTIILILTVLASAELALKQLRARKRPSAAALVRLLSLTLPFTVLGGVGGSVSWMINLLLVSTIQDRCHAAAGVSLTAWGGSYQRTLWYDLAFMELVFAGATLIFLLAIGCVFVRFVVKMKRKSAAELLKPIGSEARRGFRTALLLLAVVSSIVASLFFIDVMHHAADPGQPIKFFEAVGAAFTRGARSVLGSEPDIFLIYAASAARVAGFLPALLGPVRTGAALAADVVLYLVPDSKLSYAAAARDRLLNLLRHLQLDRDVTLLAHSQGTVIAVDALSQDPKVRPRLVTAGSPIDVLYRAFLSQQRFAPIHVWRNLYRPSDYIGGAVEAAENVSVAGGYTDNHLKYFHEPEVLRAIR